MGSRELLRQYLLITSSVSVFLVRGIRNGPAFPGQTAVLTNANPLGLKKCVLSIIIPPFEILTCSIHSALFGREEERIKKQRLPIPSCGFLKNDFVFEYQGLNPLIHPSLCVCARPLSFSQSARFCSRNRSINPVFPVRLTWAEQHAPSEDPASSNKANLRGFWQQRLSGKCYTGLDWWPVIFRWFTVLTGSEESVGFILFTD